MAASDSQFVVRYWGVRGSIPTPGPETVRYGGNTTCLEIRCGDALLMIDSGTGARALGGHLRQQGGDVHVRLLYSHHHLDHVQGFPFFLPIYSAGSHIEIYSGAKPGTARQVLASQMSFPSFPVGLDSLSCELEFHSFERGDTLHFGDIAVRTCALNHPGGATAFRIDYGGRSFVQASDHEHDGTEHCRDLLHGVPPHAGCPGWRVGCLPTWGTDPSSVDPDEVVAWLHSCV